MLSFGLSCGLEYLFETVGCVFHLLLVYAICAGFFVFSIIIARDDLVLGISFVINHLNYESELCILQK